VSNGVVYIAAGQQSSTYMFAFDAAAGTLIFKSQMSSQWENYLAPTIGSAGVYTNAGTFGGIYGFTPTGQQLFFTGLAQQSAWTPAVDSTTVYAFTGDALTLIDPISGRITGTIADPTFTNYIYVIDGSVVLGASHSAFAAAYDNSFVIGAGNYLLHFNTSALTIDWNVKGDYPHTPAYKAGVVYAVNNSPMQLEARSEVDGSLLWSWPAPASGDVAFKSEVLLTNNLVFVSTNLSTYAVDLTTHKAVWSYPVSGNLALSSDGVLYLEGINTLTAINAK
jgi:outer membrane protein assembly factor BamB